MIWLVSTHPQPIQLGPNPFSSAPKCWKVALKAQITKYEEKNKIIAYAGSQLFTLTGSTHPQSIQLGPNPFNSAQSLKR